MLFRPLSDDPAELAALEELVAAAYLRPGWVEEIERVRAVSPDGWLVGDADDGRLAVCGVATAWGSFGWVGLVATRPDLERQGLGRAMTDALCARLAAAGVEIVALDASDKGRGLYRGMGFSEEGAVRCLVAPPHLATRAEPAEPLRDGDLDELLALDAELFGARRDVLIRRLLAEGAPAFVVRAADGSLDGYALVAPNDGTIGPSGARSEEAVPRLIVAALATAPPGGGRVLLPPESVHVDAIEELGFVELRRLAHMRRPVARLPGERHLLLSEASYAIG